MILEIKTDKIEYKNSKALSQHTKPIGNITAILNRSIIFYTSCLLNKLLTYFLLRSPLL